MDDVPGDQDPSAARFEIRVQGHLARRWVGRFDGMSVTARDDGSTVIHGTVADQSALHGLLRKLSDLGVPLISVTQKEPDKPTTPARPTAAHPPSPRGSTT